jgi:hypothetical protein
MVLFFVAWWGFMEVEMISMDAGLQRGYNEESKRIELPKKKGMIRITLPKSTESEEMEAKKGADTSKTTLNTSKKKVLATILSHGYQ